MNSSPFSPYFSHYYCFLTNNKDSNPSHLPLNAPADFNKTATTILQILEFQFFLLCYIISGFPAVLYTASI